MPSFRLSSHTPPLLEENGVTTPKQYVELIKRTFKICMITRRKTNTNGDQHNFFVFFGGGFVHCVGGFLQKQSKYTDIKNKQ